MRARAVLMVCVAFIVALLPVPANAEIGALAAAECSPDANRDGALTLLDLVAVARRFGQQVATGTPEDTKPDGVIDIFDLVCVARVIWPGSGSTPDPGPPPTPADVKITSLCSQFNAPGDDHQNLNEEYVCFQNQGGQAANISGWHVKDAKNHTYTFPTFTLAAGASVKLRTGCGSNTATDVYWCHGGAVWNNTGGETVYLYDSAWVLVDSYTY